MKLKWSHELLQRISLEVRREVMEHLQSADSKSVLEFCLQKVLAEEADETPLRDAYRVYYAVASIVLLAQHPSQAVHTVPKLERIVKTLLLRNKVKPRKSLLAHVYAHVAQAVSYFHSQQGALQTALWESAVGFTQSQSGIGDNLDEQRFHYALLLFEKGSALAAADIFQQLCETSTRRGIRWQALLSRIRALRLAGHHKESEKILQDVLSHNSQTYLCEFLEWEFTMQKLRLDGPEALVEWIRSVNPSSENISMLIKHQLWMRAHRCPSYSTRYIRSTSLKRHALKTGMIDQRQKAALKALEIFESLEDAEISFDIRLGLAAQIVEQNEKLDIETRLLALAALLRWLTRANQKHLALSVLEDYGSLNLRLTQGHSNDTFGLIETEVHQKLSSQSFVAALKASF